MDTSVLEDLRAFRGSFYECLRRRGDALFELADAILTAGVFPSPVHLSLQPSHRRGWGSLYGALRSGRLDVEEALREEILPSLAEQIDTGDYAKGAASNLGPHAVALANVVEASGAQGIDIALMKPMWELVERHMADGHGDGDLSGLVELLRR